jgi:hypothetical protein
VTAGVTALRLHTPPTYTVTVVLRVSEGQLQTPERLNAGALRTHLQELTFTRAHLGDMIRQNPTTFPGGAKDVEGTVEDLRERITTQIEASDLIGTGDSDAPRTAHITLSYTGTNPQRTWQITNALADLLIDSAMERQRAAFLREKARAESVESAAQQDGERSVAMSSTAAERIRTTQAAAAAARFGVRAAAEQQALRFELVDPGQVPTPVTRAERVRDATVTFAILLLGASLLAGAFDPRLLDADDLALIGIPLVGRLPPLPPSPGTGVGTSTK